MFLYPIKNLLVLLILLMPFSVYGDVSIVDETLDDGHVPVDAYIDVDADYVAISVSLSSDAKYPLKRAKLIHQLQTTIAEAVEKNESVEMIKGLITLSPQEKSLFSMSGDYPFQSSSSFYLLIKFYQNKNFYEAAYQLKEFIASIERPDDTNIYLGKISLAVKDPGIYRFELLRKIRDKINGIKDIIGSKYKAAITGLEGLVQARQIDDRQVRLFIAYRLEFTE
jgi:hypothetical protein